MISSIHDSHLSTASASKALITRASTPVDTPRARRIALIFETATYKPHCIHLLLHASSKVEGNKRLFRGAITLKSTNCSNSICKKLIGTCIKFCFIGRIPSCIAFNLRRSPIIIMRKLNHARQLQVGIH